MKLRKLETVLISLGFGLAAIGIALFFVIPLLAGAGFAYIGLDAVVAGALSVITPNFANPAYMSLVIGGGITILVLIVWLIMICVGKQGRHIVSWLLTLIIDLALIVLVASITVATVKFNSADKVLLNAVSEVTDNILGKALFIADVALILLSALVLTLHALVDMVACGISRRVKRGFVKSIEDEVKTQLEEVVPAPEEVPEEPVQEEIVEEPAPEVVQEPIPEPVAVEEPAPVVEEPAPAPAPVETTDEGRKEREEKFFKECIDSGEFTEYVEYEFDEPLEGYTEEPVVEEVTFEETTKIHEQVRRVQVTHTKKVSVK